MTLFYSTIVILFSLGSVTPWPPFSARVRGHTVASSQMREKDALWGALDVFD
jgi:hypothetical protein